MRRRGGASGRGVGVWGVVLAEFESLARARGRPRRRRDGSDEVGPERGWGRERGKNGEKVGKGAVWDGERTRGERSDHSGEMSGPGRGGGGGEGRQAPGVGEWGGHTRGWCPPVGGGTTTRRGGVRPWWGGVRLLEGGSGLGEGGRGGARGVRSDQGGAPDMGSGGAAPVDFGAENHGDLQGVWAGWVARRERGILGRGRLSPVTPSLLPDAPSLLRRRLLHPGHPRHPRPRHLLPPVGAPPRPPGEGGPPRPPRAPPVL